MPTTIPTLPTAPLVTDTTAVFNTRAFAFNAALDAWGTATNTVATEVSASATSASTSASTATTQAGTATTQAGIATTQAGNAATSAASALTAPGTSATSTTSLTVGTGSKSLTIQTGKAYSVGQSVLIADTSLPATNWMFGQITSYNSGTGALVVTVITIAGSGTIAAWTVSLSGNPGSMLPTQTGQAGKFLGTNGTASAWGFAGISQVTVATTATTLTNTPTLLQITPASYGATVTLPDATTCSLGGPLFCIDNRGVYPVRVVNSAGTLLGFVFAGVVSYVSLESNSAAAGVWAIENNELVGASAQLLTTNLVYVDACVDLGSNQELLLGRSSSANNCFGVVYNRATNTFGSVTLVRASSQSVAAVLSAANQVLVATCTSTTTAFEAVVLSISGTTITVNTAATATLSAGFSGFADGCGLIAAGSSFVTSYTATGAAQIRALSISGTTVTIGAASVLSGTDGGLIAASGSYVIAVSTATTSLFTTPYLVSVSTLTLGTGTTTASGTMTLNKFFALGTRWAVLYNDGGGSCRTGVVSLTATGNGTTTISTVMLMAGIFADAIVVGTNKVLALTNSSGGNANILTDTAGTASAGTAITLNNGTARNVLYATGTTVVVNSAAVAAISIVDCSGVSPVRTRQYAVTSSFGLLDDSAIAKSNAVLSRSPRLIYGSRFASSYGDFSTGNLLAPALYVNGEVFGIGLRVPNPFAGGAVNIAYRGRLDSERWLADGSSVITKLETVA